MNEEKGTAECGEVEKISGGKKITSKGTENAGQIKDEKIQDVHSSVTPESERAASAGKGSRYLLMNTVL